MYDCQIHIMFLLMLILSLQSLLQSQSLETVLICIVVLCFPHNNFACIHLYDECTRSIARPHEQIYPIRAKYRHFRTICEQTVDNSPTNSFSSSLNVWSSMQRVATFIIVESFYWQVRNIFPHISSHDLPCHRTMKG